VTPARRGRDNEPKATDEGHEQILYERRASMSWAQRLQHVFNIDIKTRSACDGAVKVIACIDDPVVIEKTPIPADLLPESRSPPPDLFG